MAKAPKTSAKDAIDLLKQDHKTVDGLFKEFEKLHEAKEDTDAVIETACDELVIHDKIEMEIFYPAVREEAGEEEEELLDEAEVEHKTIEDLIAKLQPGKLEDKQREAHFTILMEYVRHHVKEEEKEMFPKIKKLEGLDLVELGAQMKERKSALKAEMGMEAVEEEASA